MNVKTGKWINDHLLSKHYCSNCGEYANTYLVHSGTRYVLEEYLDDFCPHCGTKMKVKKEVRK